MPTYSYFCKECEHEEEVFHKISEDPEIKCPECGRVCKRMIGSGGGVIFKGSGFYTTDYKKMEATQREMNKPRKEKNFPELDTDMDSRVKDWEGYKSSEKAREIRHNQGRE